MAGKISEYPAKTTFDDTDLYDCSTTGATSEKVTYAQVKDDLKNTFHTQGGNSYGAALVIGTNDNNDLVVETNGSEAVRVDTTNNVEIKGGIKTGEQVLLAQDVFLKKKVRTAATLVSVTGTAVYNLGVDFDSLVSVDIFVKSISGALIPPRHTVIANSFYDYYITENITDGLAKLSLDVQATETNFDLTSDLIVTSTYIA